MGSIMGKILVDGHPEAVEVPPGSNIGRAFELARERVQARGRVIVEIVLNEELSLTWGGR